MQDEDNSMTMKTLTLVGQVGQRPQYDSGNINNIEIVQTKRTLSQWRHKLH